MEVAALVQALSQHIVYSESSSVDTNRKLWNRYAEDWKPDANFVTKMADNLPDERDLELLGNEWSDKQSFETTIKDYFVPYLSSQFIVAEIGSGGGRVSCQVAPLVQQLECFDISAEMIKKAKQALTIKGLEKNVVFTLLDKCVLDRPDNHYDFIYAFDVFPHCDLHTIWKYLNEFKRCLKVGGRAIVHTANLNTEQGWQRFSKQQKYSEGGFYFVTNDIVNLLIKRCGGFKVIKYSVEDENTKNMYYLRDYIVLIEKIE